MKNLKMIETKFFGPTNYQGSRVKAMDANKNSITIPWDYGLNSEANHAAAANALMEKIRNKYEDQRPWNIEVSGCSASGKGYVFGVDA